VNNLTSIKSRVARKALLKKGFGEVEGDHHFLIYFVNGLKTDIRTKMSHNHEELNDVLISKMKEQVNLSKDEFIGVVDCHISKDQLHEIYVKKGKIENKTLNDFHSK